jgi:hypothetical protein
MTQTKLSIPENAIDVEYIQFASDGNSGVKVKISNASLFSGYILYTSITKL